MSDAPKLTEQQIYERIWKSIAERRLPPGTRLKEERLCEIFGVSRPHPAGAGPVGP